MSVNRRSAIKQLLYISAGMAFLPACLQRTTRASLALKNIMVDSQQEKLLAELGEAIIPTTSTPGAKALSAHLFTLIMIDDCYTKEDQQKWLRGLQQFDKLCTQKTGHTFLQCTPAQSIAFLTALDAEKEKQDDVYFFYNTTKHLTIQAYISSKYFLTNVQVYELVPARFKGCVPLKPITRKIA